MPVAVGASPAEAALLVQPVPVLDRRILLLHVLHFGTVGERQAPSFDEICHDSRRFPGADVRNPESNQRRVIDPVDLLITVPLS